MTSLQNFIDNKGQSIEQSLAQIAELQKQVAELEQRLRVEQQIHQAQRTAENEVSKHLMSLKKLFKDLCGIFPIDAIDDLVQDIQEMASEVKDSYEQYAESGRFLKGEEEEEIENQSALTEAKDLPMIVEALPEPDDDKTILLSSQVERIINDFDEDIHDFLKQQLGISRKVKKLSVLSQKIADNQLTRKRLEALIQAAKLIQSRPLNSDGVSLNGSSG